MKVSVIVPNYNHAPYLKERLDSIGFEWDGRASRSRDAWRVGSKHAQEFFNKHGDLKVPGNYACSDGYKLGNFVKKAKRDGRLPELEKELLATSDHNL